MENHPSTFMDSMLSKMHQALILDGKEGEVQTVLMIVCRTKDGGSIAASGCYKMPHNKFVKDVRENAEFAAQQIIKGIRPDIEAQIEGTKT